MNIITKVLNNDLTTAERSHLARQLLCQEYTRGDRPPVATVHPCGLTNVDVSVHRGSEQARLIGKVQRNELTQSERVTLAKAVLADAYRRGAADGDATVNVAKSASGPGPIRVTFNKLTEPSRHVLSLSKADASRLTPAQRRALARSQTILKTI